LVKAAYRRIWEDTVAADLAPAPVAIIGAGPVGIRVAQELVRRRPDLPVVIYGDEPSEPYNRVRLSGFLSGELDWQALTRDLALPNTDNITTRYGCAVTSIDRVHRSVRDNTGHVQPYAILLLATGSRPHVPDIAGIKLPGVYTFRDIGDANRLLARRVRSRRTVVLGGGLLGLEAARAMQRFNTEVTVIEHFNRLMMRQLDEAAAAALLAHVRSLGLDVVLGDGVRSISGDTRVTAVQLRGGRVLECDTVVVATGIQPNVELARAAGIHVGRGIRVDDRMVTSDPSIYALGECAEHRGRVYGFVAPGLEQAAVAAHSIAGRRTNYRGSQIAARLKVLDLPVFSIGPVTPEERLDLGREWCYREEGVYRKIVTWRGRLVGAIALGPCPEIGRFQEGIVRNRHIWPWQLWRFLRTGLPWIEAEQQNVCEWPAPAAVCNCTGVTRGQLGAALAAGCHTVEALAACTGASTVCGSCRPLLAQLAGGIGVRTPERGWKWLLGAGGVALALAVALVFFILLPYAPSVQVSWQWDVIWRDSYWKQVSGFSILSLSALLLILSPRKRIGRFTLGAFPVWRVMHAVLGALTLAALLVHTGGRLGSNLNFALNATFLGLVGLGAVAGGVIALEHRIGAAASRLRRTWTWSHILLFWPIPMLLTLHVFKTYYF
jgi:nitrite reductase (NADH) large subunit